MLELYASWERELVWTNENGTRTFRLTSPAGDRRYAKIAPPGAYPSLAEEVPRMTWAHAHLPVPRIVDSGTAADGAEWLATEALPGIDATREPLISDPTRVVPILARGLRRFHEAPVAACPFSFRLDDAMALATQRVTSGRLVPERHFHPEHAHLTAVAALALLERTRPASEDLVVCHGDYCFPNALIDHDEVAGYVDLAHLGVADRWWDLAVATWSTTWNVGTGFEETFLDAYGIPLDEPRLRFYRLLYDLVA